MSNPNIENMGEPVATDSVIANELDYKIKNYSHSSYQHTQIFQQIGLPTVSLGTSGGPDSIFQIPPCAFNLSQSLLCFQLQPTTVPGAEDTNWIFVDGISPIRQLQLYTDNNLYLSDIYDLCNYTNMIFRYTTKFEELSSLDTPTNINTNPGTYVGLTNWPTSLNEFEGLAPCYVPNNNNTVVNTGGTALLGPIPNYLGLASTVTQEVNARPVGWAPQLGSSTAAVMTQNSGYTNYYEPSYVLSAMNVNTTGPVIQYKIPLGKIKNTIFGIDKTLYFGKILYLRVVWNTTTKIGYAMGTTNANGVSQFNPAYSTGQITGDTPYQNTPVALLTTNGSGIQISNLYFYLAKETNIVVEAGLKKQINEKGFKILIPWVSQFKQNVPATQMNNITLRITSAVGKRLLKIIWAPYNATESLTYAYDHSILPQEAAAANVGTNAVNQKIIKFYTLVNNNRTSQFDYNCNNPSLQFNTDYDVKKKKLKGSSILSQNEYYYNWVWTEDFTDNVSMVDKPISEDQDTFLDGLDLTDGKEVKYDIFVNQGTATGVGTYLALNYYIYFVTLKELMINSSGISLV